MRVMQGSLTDALALPDQGALISIVGGGGKSALLFALGDRLPGRVVLTTTTRIFAAQIARAVASHAVDSSVRETDLDSVLREAPSGVLLIGHVEGEKAMGIDPHLPARWLAREDVACVVVEADGSRMRPIKAPAEHEPAIANATTDLVIALGIDALEGPLSATAHRPDRVAALLQVSQDAPLDEGGIARLVCHPEGGLKNVPNDARVVVMINKVESKGQRARAEHIAETLLREPRIDRVIAGALEGAHPDAWLACCRDEV